MLSPELKKFKRKLEGEEVKVDSELLLKELRILEGLPIKLNESLALSKGVCNCCGKKI